jgi:VIT1/CCC1 family predicted Fe2+/Mn2+ transporter
MCRELTGEYVSVSSQADTEKAAIDEERAELAADGQGEHRELAAIYVRRGLDLALARQVAEKLMAHDALGAHARDELGISEITTAKPLQAARVILPRARSPVAIVTAMPRPSILCKARTGSTRFCRCSHVGAVPAVIERVPERPHQDGG